MPTWPVRNAIPCFELNQFSKAGQAAQCLGGWRPLGSCHTLCPAPRLPCPDCHPRLPAQRRAGPPYPPTGWRGAAGRRTRSTRPARRGESRSWCFGRGRQSRLGGRGQAVLGASMTGGAAREPGIWSVPEEPANREHP